MASGMSPAEKAKYSTAKRAVEYVRDGMRVGLGTGSTAAWMVRCLGDRVRQEGLKITGVATSQRTEELAYKVGVPVLSLDEVGWLDLTIDGADECDADLNLIKGGGGALLREKIVATASDQMIVIADISKRVGMLGAFPLPIEIIPFGWQATKTLVEETITNLDVMGRTAILRMNMDRPFVTDQGNYILDLHLRRIAKAGQLSLVLNQIPGVVENGLFLDMCDILLTGYPDGTVEVRDINGDTVTGEGDEDNVFIEARD